MRAKIWSQLQYPLKGKLIMKVCDIKVCDIKLMEYFSAVNKYEIMDLKKNTRISRVYL